MSLSDFCSVMINGARLCVGHTIAVPN